MTSITSNIFIGFDKSIKEILRHPGARNWPCTSERKKFYQLLIFSWHHISTQAYFPTPYQQMSIWAEKHLRALKICFACEVGSTCFGWKKICNNCDWLIVKPVFSGQCPLWNSMETRNGSQIVSSTERKGELVKTLTNSESNPPKNQVKIHFFIWWRAADVEPSIKQGQLHKTLIIGIWWP